MLKINQKVVEDCWKKMLKDGFGLDLQSTHLKGTPDRIARFYREFFGSKKYKYTDFNEDKYGGMVIIRSTGFSMCSHHFLPYSYDCFCGYIPDGKIIGASKIPRIIDQFAKKPTVQEQLTQQIAEFIYKKFSVQGVIVSMVGEHLCMIMRGVRKNDSRIITSYPLGNFTDQLVRDEFFNLIKLWGNR